LKTSNLFFSILFISAQVFAQSEDSSRYYYLKASEAKAGRQYMLAYQNYKRSLKTDSTNKETLRECGITAVDLRKYDEAIPVFEKVLKISPADTTAITQLAVLYFYAQQWEKSISYSSRALQMGIGNKNYYRIGKSYYELEDYGHAFSYLPSAAAEEPELAEIPYMIARSYVDMDNYKPAIPYFQKAISLDSGKVQWIYECALVFATINDDQNALKYYNLAAGRGYKKDNDFYENLADAYLSTGNPDKALQIFQDLLLKKPADLEILNSLAFINYRIKNYDTAIEYWNRILAYDKQNARALYMIGMSYQKKGDTEKGKTLCERAISMDPSLRSYIKRKNAG
jgi:tetratricopeptide (TPR) repeat protein